MASTAAATSDIAASLLPPLPSPPSPFVLRMPAADDFHLHLRDDPLLADLVPHAAAQVPVVPPLCSQSNGHQPMAIANMHFYRTPSCTMHFSDAIPAICSSHRKMWKSICFSTRRFVFVLTPYLLVAAVCARHHHAQSAPTRMHDRAGHSVPRTHHARAPRRRPARRVRAADDALPHRRYACVRLCVCVFVCACVIV
jgi:hypothetical protein